MQKITYVPVDIQSPSTVNRTRTDIHEPSRWKLYMIFMALCYLMAIVVYLYYPVRTYSLHALNTLHDCD